MYAAGEVNVALVGIAGYGEEYLTSLLRDARAAGTRLAGVVDLAPHRCLHLEELHRRGVPVHSTLEHLFDASPAIDLTMIATPIHLHALQTCIALENGANVLCEKPLAASIKDALQMAACEHASGGKFVAIGYQWSFSDAIQSLKRDIAEGLLGRPLRMKTVVFFPRGESYFSRNDWAGRVRTSSGEVVLDSPANNATAHYLHNMFYLLGDVPRTSAMPVTVQAELYRANQIDNYDTTALRASLSSGCEVLFYTTHAVHERLGPRCHFEFEHAVVEYDFMSRPRFIARFRDGRVRDYGDPNRDRTQKIWQCIAAVRTRATVACGIEAAMAHTVAVCSAQESVNAITDFPTSARRIRLVQGTPMIGIDGLAETLGRCFEQGCLPAETGGLTWARAGSVVRCEDLLAKARAAFRRVSTDVPSIEPAASA